MEESFPGQIRPSQLVTTFGPGSIMDLRDDSVMVLGLDYWPSKHGLYRIVTEPRLESTLRVEEFRVPVGLVDDGNIPCTTFPRYRVCTACNSLAPAYRDVSRQRFACKACGGDVTHPARLIMACPMGHIDDFPWSEWVHQGAGCSNPQLKLRSLYRTAALSDLRVECDACKVRPRDLGDALSPDGVAKVTACTGLRPWLMDKEDDCEESPRGLQRGASNVYFAATDSSISIPPWTNPIHEELERHWPTISRLASDLPVLDGIIRGVFSKYDRQDVLNAIKRRQGLRESGDLRNDEWVALRTDVPIADREFEVLPEEVPVEISPWIEKIARVQRLKELRVVRGFTRIDPPDPENQATTDLVSLSRTRLKWLPAVEVFGEGIFLALAKDKLESWEAQHSTVERITRLFGVYEKWRKQRNWSLTKLPAYRLVLLHTLSHIIIRQLALDSGYTSASIRERLYSSESMRGILLYTSSDDSEGSLGGLVQHGRPSAFKSLFERSIFSSSQCSSDPLCLENDPETAGSLNGAACHVCTFVSETSCEMANRLLDRRLILPERDYVESYFRDFGTEP